MTPHCHWLHNYTPHCIPITLVNNTAIYSAGVRSVVFYSKLKGEVTRAVGSTCVLHVPDLHNNLLSVLYLTCYASFIVSINSTHMTFACPPGLTLFVATITGNNMVFLDGVTESVTEQVLPAMTVRLGWSFWHRQFAHHDLAGIKLLLDQNMVHGLKLDLKTAPDPVCMPCLTDKMHANLFPPSTLHSSRLLELVYTDVHHMAYPLFSSCCYWVTCIDDYSRYHFVLPIKHKSDVFEVFKTFKAFVEPSQSTRSRLYEMTRVESRSATLLPSLSHNVEFCVSTLSKLVLSRMGLLHE